MRRSIAAIVAATLLTGCAESAKSPSMHDRQDQAMRDPFGYKVDAGKDTDISGGGLFDYDHDAMQKDLDNVLNP